MIPKASVRKKIISAILYISALFLLCACAPEEEEKIPVVSCDDSGVYVNGKAVAASGDRIEVGRIDSRAVCLSVMTGSGTDMSVNTVNVDPEGNEIKLSDVITDRLLYEAAIRTEIERPQIRIRDAVSYEPEVDRDAMKEFMSSYDNAMTLPFRMDEKGISITYTDGNGVSSSVSFSYDSGLVDKSFVPGDGILCSSWMIGRVGYGVAGMKLDGYTDHWAESSLKIENYNGHTYYWFCVAYKDDEENRTYYSVIAEGKDDGREAVSIRQTEGPFVCCDLEEFGSLLEEP